METLATVTSALPTSLLTRVARQQTQSVDFATSNVRTSPVPYFIAGAKALESYAIGPLGGVSFNVTMLSYVKHLDLGIHIDAAAVDDPPLLATPSTRRSGSCAGPAEPESRYRPSWKRRASSRSGKSKRKPTVLEAPWDGPHARQQQLAAHLAETRR